MPKLRYESTLPISPKGLFDLHARPEALRRLSPPFPPIRSVEQSGGFETGTTVRIRIGIGPLVLQWTALLEEVSPGKRFVDVQLEGPFASWRHEHSFLPAPGGCLMRDEVSWRSRGVLAALDEPVVAPMLRHYFRTRHEALRQWVREENEGIFRQEPGTKREAS